MAKHASAQQALSPSAEHSGMAVGTPPGGRLGSPSSHHGFKSPDVPFNSFSAPPSASSATYSPGVRSRRAARGPSVPRGESGERGSLAEETAVESLMALMTGSTSSTLGAAGGAVAASRALAAQVMASGESPKTPQAPGSIGKKCLKRDILPSAPNTPVPPAALDFQQQHHQQQHHHHQHQQQHNQNHHQQPHYHREPQVLPPGGLVAEGGVKPSQAADAAGQVVVDGTNKRRMGGDTHMARAVKEAKLRNGSPSNREMLMGCLRIAEEQGLIQRRPQAPDAQDSSKVVIDITDRDEFIRLLASGYYENNPNNKKVPQEEYVRDMVIGMCGRLKTETNMHRKHQPLETFKAALKRCGIIPSSK